MISANLQQWIEHPETLNKDTLYELRTLVARYPYFQSVRLLYLKNLFLLHDITFGAELRKAIVYVADRRKLFYLIEGARYSLQPQKRSPVSAGDEAVMEAEPSLDRTLTLIDAFLSTVPEEIAGQAGLDYAMDYTSYLLQEEIGDEAEGKAEVPKLRGQDLIDGFIEMSETETSIRLKPLEERTEEGEEEHPEEDEPEDVHQEEDEDDSCFTETLAKIYVKQQRYSKALEIIKKLSLKYPKKNAYFADQIRFLEKLIINAKSK